MKRILSNIFVAVFIHLLVSCEDPTYISPNISTTPGNLSANFLLVNGVSSNAEVSLDFYLNNTKAGSSQLRATGQNAYTNITLPTNAVVPTGTPISNTGVRAKATTGTIGGVLGASDLIFRAGNTNTNNFAAADSAFYTFIALDSLSRLRPLRTFNTLGIGDTTYLNPLTGQYVAGKDTWALPAAVKARRVAIGTVPLGATDPGGVRFLVLTDQLPLPNTRRFPKPSANRFAVRFVHAAPDVGTVTVTVNGTALSSGILSYPLSFPTFNPSVGSRSTTADFANNFGTLAPGSYTVEVRVGSTLIASLSSADFTGDRGVYTIVLTGQRNKANLSLVVVKNK